MEILMNIKCSSNANSTSIRPTLKVVDHHHQLQQQHNPLKAQHLSGHQHTHHLMYGKPSITITSTKEMSLSPCMEYTVSPTAPPQPPHMDCCSGIPPHTKNITDLQWAQAHQKRIGLCNGLVSDCPPLCEYAPCCSGMEIPACCAYGATPPVSHILLDSYSTMGTQNHNESNTFYEYQEPEENFVSIEDEKIKAFLLKVGEEQKLKEKSKKVATTTEVKKNTESQPPVVFEIIELDDIDERERLQRIRASAEQRAKENKLQSPNDIQNSFIKSASDKEKRKSPCISLIPRNTENKSSTQQEKVSPKPQEKIIASIDLLDSDSSESENESNHNTNELRSSVGLNNTDDNYEDVDNEDSTCSRLIAATAVSCELGCDEENEEQDSNEPLEYKNETRYSSAASADEQVYILNSDDEENIEFIEEQEEGLELRWDDLEDHSSSNSRGERQLFQCPVCGKKVQSNYNLRRHMMIHTGERPFGCDLCERRFREISDLKKHRRRHATEKNFVCMICRINAPLETDSTRCDSCDTKNGTLIAAVRPDTVKTPPEIEQMFGTSLRSERRKCNMASNTGNVSSIEPPPTNNLPTLTPITSKPSVETTKNQSENIITKAIVHSSYPSTLRSLSRKDFECPLCKRSFGTRHNLKRHFMIHTGEKPFSCPSCRKPFREYSTLKKHLATHRRERWYKCLRCPQKYRDYLDYIEHKRTHGSDVSSDDGSTPTKRWKYHNDEHEDAYFTNDEDEDCDDDDNSMIEDCLECCECGQRFTDIDQFTEHIKEHDSNRIMYECYMCKQLFDDHKDLVDHMNSSHQMEEETDD